MSPERAIEHYGTPDGRWIAVDERTGIVLAGPLPARLEDNLFDAAMNAMHGWRREPAVRRP